MADFWAAAAGLESRTTSAFIRLALAIKQRRIIETPEVVRAYFSARH